MKITVFGASGTVGQRIVQEALMRKHEVTAVVRHPESIQVADTHFAAKASNVLDLTSVAQLVEGQDAVISAIGPAKDQSPQILVEAARSLLTGLALAEVLVKRVFLPRIEALSMLPTANGGGYAGRPGPQVPGIAHLYLAGD